MDDELRQRSRPLVRPPPVDQEQICQMRELRNAEVSGQTGLFSFSPLNPDAGVRLLDHADVVAAVAHRRRPFPGVFLDELDHLSLLRGRAAATDDRRRRRRQLHEFLLVVGEADFEAFAAYHQGAVLFSSEGVQFQVGVRARHHLLEDVEALGARHQTGALGNAGGGFQFVAGQHPDLDAGVAEEFQRGSHVVLELVFDAGDAEEFHFALEGFDHLGDAGHAVGHR